MFVYFELFQGGFGGPATRNEWPGQFRRARPPHVRRAEAAGAAPAGPGGAELLRSGRSGAVNVRPLRSVDWFYVMFVVRPGASSGLVALPFVGVTSQVFS